MKRFAVYILIIVCIVACRKEKSGMRISGKDFLNRVFPTYTFLDFEYSKLVYALRDYEPEGFIDYTDQIYPEIKGLPVHIEANFGNQFYTRYGLADSFKKLMKDNYWELGETERTADWNNHLIQYLDQGQYQFFRNYLVQEKQHVQIYFVENPMDKTVRCSFDRPIFNESKDKALLKGNYTIDRINSMALIYSLTKVDGKWKVLGHELIYNYF